jgi:ribosomal protein S1
MNFETGTGTLEGFETEKTTSNEFEKALTQFNSSFVFELQINKIYPGTLAEINNRYFAIDINAKSLVYVDNNALENPILSNLQIGNDVSVMVTEVTDKKDYMIKGSVYNTVLQNLMSTLIDNVTNKHVLSGVVTDMSHAGYTVKTTIDEQEINLFMPHLLADVNKLPDPTCLVDSEIEFIIDTFDKDGQTQYIASRKKYLKTLIKQKTKDLTKGEKYSGVVINTTDFGIFIQFEGCLTGLIHKSNLSKITTEFFDKKEIVPGMGIEFFLKDIVKGKMFLTQVDTSSLWDNIKIGDNLTGSVYNTKDFGVLVSLDFETKGLLHRSNLSKDPSRYKKGETLYVTVTNVNKQDRQITLKLS